MKLYYVGCGDTLVDVGKKKGPKFFSNNWPTQNESCKDVKSLLAKILWHSKRKAKTRSKVKITPFWKDGGNHIVCFFIEEKGSHSLPSQKVEKFSHGLKLGFHKMIAWIGLLASEPKSLDSPTRVMDIIGGSQAVLVGYKLELLIYVPGNQNRIKIKSNFGNQSGIRIEIKIGFLFLEL